MYSAVSQNLQFFEHNTTLSLILPLTDTYITYHLDISLRYYTYFLPYFSQKSRVGTFKCDGFSKYNTGKNVLGAQIKTDYVAYSKI